MLFINAVNEVTRERAQSILTDEHIERIVRVYQGFRHEYGFSQVVPVDEIRQKGSNLSITLYVRANGSGGDSTVSEKGPGDLQQAIAAWQESSVALRESMESLFKVLENGISVSFMGHKLSRLKNNQQNDR